MRTNETNGVIAAIRVVGVYARVSTLTGQTVETQLAPLREYAAARGWRAMEFTDAGVSGTRERRPGLDALMAAARARRIDAVVCVRLDRLARSMRHLLTMTGELEAWGVALVVTEQAIDTTSPTGRLLFGVLGALAEFERSLIVDRVRAGIKRAQAQGTKTGRPIGRPRRHYVNVSRALALLGEGQSLRAVARRLRVHPEALRQAVRKASAATP